MRLVESTAKWLERNFVWMLWRLAPWAASFLRWRARRFPRRAVLYVGQAYYNAWYLSRALRGHGWRADVLSWDPEVCDICQWKHVPAVCSSDERNFAWGQFRKSIADYQCQFGGNRMDYNDDSTVHEVPEFIEAVE